jgi:2-amino-4,5-dihydroxy-6-oxo-7-(phosphonooxy)heptanoate synthase
MPTDNDCFGRRLRRQRLHHHGDDRLLVVPLDHSVTDGPIVRDGRLDDLVRQICENGADAVVLHKGSARHVRPQWFVNTSLILHLSAGTSDGPDPDAKCLVANVEEAIRLGADAVSVHVNLGSEHELSHIRDLARVAEACDRWRLPLLAMIYPRGRQVSDPRDPCRVAHAVTLAADLGADLVKTVNPGSVTVLADIVAGSEVPVLVAGGPVHLSTEDLIEAVDDALLAGAAGAAIGRNIFAAPDPGAVTRKISDLIHTRGSARDLLPLRALTHQPAGALR